MADKTIAADFNPLEPGYVEDPFAQFERLRELAPVQQTALGPWVIFRYADVHALLRDPSLSVDEANADLAEFSRAQLMDELLEGREIEPSTSMLDRDPPDHTRLRRLVQKAFTPRTIEGLRPLVGELVDTALDGFDQRGGGDVVGDLAFPLPFDVISSMLGMPESDKDSIRDWSGALVKTLDPVLSPEEVLAAADAHDLMTAHISDVIEWKGSHPGPDVLTALIEAEHEGDKLSRTELVDQVTLLFVAGHETTVNLIGTGIFELFRRPDQLAAWRDEPSLGPRAVDELLRFVSPVQFSRRIATADMDIGGHAIGEGALILTGLASANHDPAKFGGNAGELDLTRHDASHHVSFGSGAHYCLGAHLAKLEGEIAIGSFIRRFPEAEMVADPVWNGRMNLRGLDSLRVEV